MLFSVNKPCTVNKVKFLFCILGFLAIFLSRIISSCLQVTHEFQLMNKIWIFKKMPWLKRDVKKIFEDKVSAVASARPGIEDATACLKPNDTLVVWRYFRNPKRAGLVSGDTVRVWNGFLHTCFGKSGQNGPDP